MGYTLSLVLGVAAVAVAALALVRARGWVWRRKNAGGEFRRHTEVILESMGDGVTVLTLSGVQLDCNRAFCEMTGFTREELMGVGFPKPYWPPENYEEIQSSFRRASEGRFRAVELTFMRKNGERFPVLITPSLSPDSKGEVTLVATYKDITDIKRVESNLRESQTFLAKAQQVAHIGSWQWDFKTNRVRWSEELCRINGIGGTEFAGTIEESMRTIHPEDRQMMQGMLRRTEAMSSPQSMEYRIIRPDGTERVVMGEGELYYDDEGTPVGMIGTVQDITSRRDAERATRKSESQFRTIFENAPVMIDSFDKEGRCLLWNAECEQKLGWKAEEIQAHPDPLTLFYPDPDLRQTVIENIQGTDGQFREYQVLARDGSIRTQLWANFRLPDGNIISVGHDITARKLAEEELERSKDQLRALASRVQAAREEQCMRMAREIHDELGQRLTALKLDLAWVQRRLDLIVADASGEAVASKMTAMAREIDETVRVVRRLSTQLRPVVLDDLGLAGALEWQANDFASRTGIQCDLRLDIEALELDADRATAVFRIFQEILTNVARHARASEVEITVCEEKSVLELTVVDNGVGVKAGDLSSPDALGILGMKERALVFGGTVTISGDRSSGTRVHVRLPLGSVSSGVSGDEFEGRGA